MIHETLTYELFRAAGVPAPRTGHAFVRVNGEAYGVYLDVETPDSVWLSRWFPTTGHLYEGAYGTDVDGVTVGDFEVDIFYKRVIIHEFLEEFDETHPLVRAYHQLLVWDIEQAPAVTRVTERVLNPVLGKSVVVYASRPSTDVASAERRERVAG